MEVYLTSGEGQVYKTSQAFKRKRIFLPDLVQFCWKVKCILSESIRSIMSLKEEHSIEKAKRRYSSVKPNSLSNIINPIILKLTKEEDYSEMSTLGFCYSPSHP
ncbi:hypothetical protein RMATCC62417_15705 [Rhizopus microsporus]|nr:hypothetical protein RMATCC62417_15705 [Rhizopus microsporus]